MTLTTIAAYPDRATGTPPIWNSGSPYPEGSVTCPLCSGEGWLIPSMYPTDEQIATLLCNLVTCRVEDEITVVREWIKNL